MGMDADLRCAIVETRDGRSFRESLDAGWDEPAWRDLRRIKLDADTGLVEVGFASGRIIRAEVFEPGQDEVRRAGRPSVYLDQLHWVDLARVEFSPKNVRTAEIRSAGQRIIELARAGQIILPLSGGHELETTVNDGSWRTDVATLMLELSRGWVLAYPVDVRRQELVAEFIRYRDGAERAAQLAPLTLQIDRLHSQDRSTLSDAIADEWPPETEMLLRTLISIGTLFSVLIEDEKIPKADEAAIAWADSMTAAAQHLASNHLARKVSRRWTRTRFEGDMGPDFLKAAVVSGLRADRFAEWLADDAEASYARMPYLGLCRESLHLRLMNAQDTWEANDLVDWLYLPLAAAYTDVVIGEKKWTGYLKRAARGRPEIRLERTLPQGLAAVAELLA